MDAMDIMKRLQEPFEPSEIEWRVDRGQKTAKGNFVIVLAYVTNRAIMNRLDEVFSPFGWKNEFREWRGQSQICGISVKYGDEWITKWDGSDDSNMDKIKGGLSSAMKRTAVQWGIGRYLYNLDQARIPLKESGQNWTNVKVKVGGNDEYITGYWNTPTLPNWALPKGFNPVMDTEPEPEPESKEEKTSNKPKPNNLEAEQAEYFNQLKKSWEIHAGTLKGFVQWYTDRQKAGMSNADIYRVFMDKISTRENAAAGE